MSYRLLVPIDAGCADKDQHIARFTGGKTKIYLTYAGSLTTSETLDTVSKYCGV